MNLLHRATLAALLLTAPAAAQSIPQHQLPKAWKCGGDTEVRPVQSAKAWLTWLKKNPGTQNWRIAACNFARDFHGTERLPRAQQLDMARLSRAAGGLSSAADYREYATMLASAHEMSAVHMIVSEGMVKDALSPSDPEVRQLLQMSARGRIEEKQLIAQLEASNEPRHFAIRADWHLANGAPAKALDLYAKALDVDAAKQSQILTRMGIAQYQLGQADAAAASFAKVKGGDTQEDVATFWRIFIARK